MKNLNYEFPSTVVRNAKIRASILAGSVKSVDFNGSNIPMQPARERKTDFDSMD